MKKTNCKVAYIDRCQQKIPNENVLNGTKAKMYSKSFIVMLKQPKRLFSRNFTLCIWPSLTGYSYA